MKFNKLFHSVDVHTAGKALRIITSGVPFLQGKTMLEKQHYFSQHFDHIRKVLLEEPRGHKDLQGCLITPPVSADAHFGALLLDQEGACSTMEGHDMMGIVGNGIELGLFEATDSPQQQIMVDTLAGPISIILHHEHGGSYSVSYQPPPFVLVKHRIPIQLNGSKIPISITHSDSNYGDYIIVKLSDLLLKLDLNHVELIKKIGESLLNDTEPLIGSASLQELGLTNMKGIIFFDSMPHRKSAYQNLIMRTNGQMDRSPCSSAIAALATLLYTERKIGIDESIVFQSISGGQLEIKVLSTTTLKNLPAVRTEVKGTSYLTSLRQFMIDPSDPLKEGFLLK